MATTVELGTEAEVRRLFSYPNNSNEVGFLDQSLEQTIQVYLGSSARRDGWPDATFEVLIERGRVALVIDGPAEQHYPELVSGLLGAGRIALEASRRLNLANRWLYNWRFFLPLGCAMVHHKTVQLLHFPPDYVLQRDQDYLRAHTTRRWNELLLENGADPEDPHRYQTIVDITPIAAPSDAGLQLEGIHEHFTAYTTRLLELWLPRPDGSVRPMVAFGAPVRAWLARAFGLELRVLGLEVLRVGDLEVPVLGANHPSLIYNAVKLLDDAGSPEPETFAKAMRIMQQDLVVADWQARMGTDPAADPAATLGACKVRWADPARRGRMCELTYVQAFGTSPEEARRRCAAVPELPEVAALDASIDALRDQLGALDGREQDRISSP